MTVSVPKGAIEVERGPTEDERVARGHKWVKALLVMVILEPADLLYLVYILRYTI